MPEVDFIVHAASIASPTYYRKYPIKTMDANVQGLRNLLDHARVSPISSMLYFSTSEIYGDPDPAWIPTPEEYRGYVSCTGPRACYDESKRYGETLCVNFWSEHKIPIKIVRPFNNYGPGLNINDGRVIPDFFRDALSGKDIVLFSRGEDTRTFCYTSDAVTGYLLALMSGFNGEPFNIGSESPEVTMLQLAERVIKVTGTSRGVRFAQSPDQDYLTDNPRRRCPNIRKAREKLGYTPQVTLDEGLSRILRYYQYELSEASN
jgi:UDP-glucuronate decarboxylase